MQSVELKKNRRARCIIAQRLILLFSSSVTKKWITDLKVPLAYSGRVNKQLGQVQVVSERDATQLQLLLPITQ